MIRSDGSGVYTPSVSPRRGGATTYELSDRLGTASLQTNASKSTTATRTYDVFGMLVASTGTPQGPFGFAGGHGYQEDGDTGLKLLGHRYYDASTGRFLTRDPIKDGRNWYAYCDGNPLVDTDADGLQGRNRPRPPRGGGAGNGPLADAFVDALIDWWLSEQEKKAEAERYLKNLESQKARMREAKREAGIPQGQQPDAKGFNGKGERWYEFWRYSPKTGYKETIIVVVHEDASVHWGHPKADSPHRKGGAPRYTRPSPKEGTDHVGQPYKDRYPTKRWRWPKSPRPKNLK